MKVPRRLIAIAERMSTDKMPAVVLPTDPARQPTAKTAIPEADEAPSTAESMRSIGDADLEARGWNEGPDSTFDRGFSLWDADDTPDALPDDHPDRSNGAEAPTTLDPAGPAIEVKEEPEPTSFWTRAAVFQASLALLGLFFVTAPTGLTLGLQALDDAVVFFSRLIKSSHIEFVIKCDAVTLVEHVTCTRYQSMRRIFSYELSECLLRHFQMRLLTLINRWCEEPIRRNLNEICLPYPITRVTAFRVSFVLLQETLVHQNG